MADLNIAINVVAGPAKKALNDTAKATNNLSKSIVRAQASTQKMGRQFNSTTVATNKFAKGAMQQAGYQIADFSVQVTNGTSAIQAFGQQGSQMLAVFGPVGSLLGAAVAIVAGLGVAMEGSIRGMLGLSASSDDVKRSVDSLNASMVALSETYNSDVPQSLDKAREKFGDLGGALTEFIDATRGDAVKTSRAELKQLFEDLGRGAKLTGQQLEAARVRRQGQRGSLGGVQAAERVTAAYEKTLREQRTSTKKLLGPMDDLEKLYKRIVVQQEELSGPQAEEVLKQLLALRSGFDEADKSVLGLVEGMASFISQMDSFQGHTELRAIGRAFIDGTESIRDQNEELAERNKRFGQPASALKREIQYLELQRDISKAKGQIDFYQLGIRRYAIEAQYELNVAAEALLETEKERLEAEREAKTLSQQRAREAQAKADQERANLKSAERSYARALAQIDLQTESLRTQNRMFGEAKSKIDEQVKLKQILVRLEEQGSKLSVGDLILFHENIGLLQEQAGLLAHKKEEQKLQEERERETNAALKKINAERERAQRRINQLIGDGFRTAGDAVAGLISGTNTWREALTQVLRKVIDIAAQMGTTKSGGFSFDKLFGAVGGLFGGGPSFSPVSQAGPIGPGGVQTFHTGGIVGRNSGPIGPRSDERLIMARTGERVLNRGEAMGSAGGGGVVVNQTINLSTGVQQTVRAEVMSLAPQIAAQAKAAVLDAKKRGGGFGAAFA